MVLTLKQGKHFDISRFLMNNYRLGLKLLCTSAIEYYFSLTYTLGKFSTLHKRQ